MDAAVPGSCRRRASWTVILAALVLWVRPGAVADVGARESSGAGDRRQEWLAPSGRSIDLRQVLHAPVEDVLRVVTDYERYADMVPDIFSAEVLRREADLTDVRFKYHLVMAGDLEITRRFVQHGQSRVDFSTLGGDLAELSGSWNLKPGEAPDTTEVAYQASLKPGFEAPGFLVRYVLRSEAPRILDRVERLAKAKPKS
jgi:ribosome-associated toxin RatA of RatAB toxin-antitoxin module